MSDTHTGKQSAFAELSAWLESPLGQALIAEEKKLMDSMLARRFGYHLLQMSCSNIPLYDNSPVGHKFCITSTAEASMQSAVALPERLPLHSESVDLVILHHALDFSGHQHQLLREVDRVLIAGGQLFIVGFNPFSTWGIRHKLQRRAKRSPWQARLLSSLRLSDWLKLLDFQVEQIQYGMYALPLNYPRLIRYSSLFGKPAARLNWPTGGIYVISARKQAMPVTPIREPWKPLASPGRYMPLGENAKAAAPHPREQRIIH